jgi:hypothetical protein
MEHHDTLIVPAKMMRVSLAFYTVSDAAWCLYTDPYIQGYDTNTKSNTGSCPYATVRWMSHAAVWSA